MVKEIYRAIFKKCHLCKNLHGDDNIQGLCCFCGKFHRKNGDNCNYPDTIIRRIKKTKLYRVIFLYEKKDNN